ncbi:MAG: phosphoribosyl-ATP diphosphatase [Magnetovibrio sp.]|nr:phosphoribosyl-ATP diphosphatase [Magnetovibrio sp.]
MSKDSRIIEELYDVIASRRGGDPETSYTSKLFHRGTNQIAKKLGEEATEVVVASLGQSPADVVSESADLLYHLMVLWADQGIRPDAVWAELERRFGVSGIDEKKLRKRAKNSETPR